MPKLMSMAVYRCKAMVSLLGTAVLFAGCARHSLNVGSRSGFPEITLIDQVNAKNGEKIKVGYVPPMHGASTLYFKSSVDNVPGGSLLLQRCLIDYGGGRREAGSIVSLGFRRFAVVVPTGYRIAADHVKCELACLNSDGHFAKEWALKPLPDPARTLLRPARDPVIVAYHTRTGESSAIEIDLRKPPKPGWVFAGWLTRLSFVDGVNFLVFPGAPFAIPFASDQDAGRIVWWWEKPVERTGLLRLDDCSVEAVTGKIYLNVNQVASVVVPGRGIISIPKQTVQADRIRHVKVGGFAATLKGAWSPLPSHLKPPLPFGIPPQNVGVADTYANDPTTVTFNFVGPELSKFGFVGLRISPQRSPNMRAPGEAHALTPGRLPPLSIRYYCDWWERGPVHQSDIPIEAKRPSR